LSVNGKPSSIVIGPGINELIAFPHFSKTPH
jgi:hypothetical protein